MKMYRTVIPVVQYVLAEDERSAREVAEAYAEDSLLHMLGHEGGLRVVLVGGLGFGVNDGWNSWRGLKRDDWLHAIPFPSDEVAEGFDSLDDINKTCAEWAVELEDA